MEYESPSGVGSASYTDPNPTTGDPGALIRAPALENHQRELVNLITLAGLTPSRADPTQIGQAVLALIANATRRRLLVNLDYYLSPSGSDAAAGSIGAPWLTLQKAFDELVKLDLGGRNALIHMADGTYTAPLHVLQPFTGHGQVSITGNPVNPQNVILSVAGAPALNFDAPVAVYFEGMEINVSGTPGSAANCLLSRSYARVSFSAVRFGSTPDIHMQADNYGSIYLLGPYSIVGNAQSHWSARHSGTIVGAPLVTLVGTRAFSYAFATAFELGNLRVAGVSFAGPAATGSKRYEAANLGLIFTSGAATTLFPGTINGTQTAGGQYT